MIRVLIADDHLILRRGLSLILSETHDLSPVGDIRSTEDLFSFLQSDAVDLVVMNLAMRDGTDVLQRLRTEFPRLPVLTYNSVSDELAMKALRAGASGYVPRQSSPDELLIALRRLSAGGTYVSAEMAEKIAVELARGAEEDKPHERLSRRELEVFRLIGAGRSVGEIAKKLRLSVKTSAHTEPVSSRRPDCETTPTSSAT